MKAISKPIIGVDPAFRDRGFSLAIIDTDRTIRFVTFKRFLSFFGWLRHEAPKSAIWYVENSNLQDITFSAYFNNRMSLAQRSKISRSVGKNMAASQITYDMLVDVYGQDNVVNVSPKAKGAKWKNDSIPTAFCRSIKLQLPTNKKMSQDERDALKLALRHF